MPAILRASDMSGTTGAVGEQRVSRAIEPESLRRSTGWLREAGLYRPEQEQWIFPTLRQALKAYQQETREIGSPANQEM